MASSPRVLEPRRRTPAAASHASRGAHLPDDVLAEHVRRLSVAAAVGAGLWAYGLLMDTLVVPLALGRVAPRVSVATEVAGMLASVLLVLYVRHAGHTADAKARAGLLYLVLNAAGVAVLNSWQRPLTDAQLGQLSWNTVVILVGSMIMPASPRRMLAAALVAASMDPLGTWIAHLRGLATPSLVQTLVIFMPNYACAVVATLPAHVLQRIGQRLRQARALGSYELVERLGRGGMGEVWLARHRLLARHAAVKIVRPELLGAESDEQTGHMLARFEREAQATAALSSPHTIRLFDFGITTDRTFYYVMELLSGRDLESLVRDFGPVEAERAVFLLMQVCHSLADAHARGLVHRDVTPANIYLCRMGLEYDFVKVLDFGLVKRHGRARPEDRLQTAPHTTTGTPGFMAPELIVDGPVDERADLYALGCVAYVLLTGQPVFEANTSIQVLAAHLEATPLPPSARTELPIPSALDDLVLACLEKEPARRPRSAREVLDRLRHIPTSRRWDHDTARGWWDVHLPELAGPLGVEDEPRVRSGVAAALTVAGS
ncbi:MAG: serine/threonine-protein kinase [Vicinamibacterales bacterium]